MQPVGLVPLGTLGVGSEAVSAGAIEGEAIPLGTVGAGSEAVSAGAFEGKGIPLETVGAGSEEAPAKPVELLRADKVVDGSTGVVVICAIYVASQSVIGHMYILADHYHIL